MSGAVVPVAVPAGAETDALGVVGLVAASAAVPGASVTGFGGASADDVGDDGGVDGGLDCGVDAVPVDGVVLGSAGASFAGEAAAGSVSASSAASAEPGATLKISEACFGVEGCSSVSGREGAEAEEYVRPAGRVLGLVVGDDSARPGADVVVEE